MRWLLADLWEAARRKRFVTYGVTALIALDLVLGLLARIPLHRHIGRLRVAAEDLKVKAGAAVAEYEQTRRLAVEVHETLEACVRFRNEVAKTKEEQYLPFKRSLERIVGVGGAGAPAIAFKIVELKEGFLEASATCEMTGAYARLRQVLSDLQRCPEFLIVDQVSMSRRDTGRTASQQARANLKVSTVFTQARAVAPTDPMAEERAPERPKPRKDEKAPERLVTPLAAPRADGATRGGGPSEALARGESS